MPASASVVTTVTTLQEFTEFVETTMSADGPVWYRGLARADHSLVPSLFRHPTRTTPEELIATEQELLQRFRERSIPYQQRGWSSGSLQDWELLFVMQHYGVPTRLLDWTENPFIGLFFALAMGRPSSPPEDAAVWALRPEVWNRFALSDISYPGPVLSTGSTPLGSYAPTSDVAYMRMQPVAMFGLHNSPRIVAQRGVFTIFGKSTDAMEDLPAPADALVKVQIPAGSVTSMRESLFRIGVTDSVVFPDLTGLAVEIKRQFGFEA